MAHGQSVPASGRRLSPRRSLSVKLMLFVAGMIILTAGAVGWVGYEFARQTLREQIEQRLKVVAAERQKLLLSYVNQQHERVGLVASRTQLRKLIGEMQQAEGGGDADGLRQAAVEILDDAQHATEGFLQISVADPGGLVIASTDNEMLDENVADVPEFQRGREVRQLGAPYEKYGRYVAWLTAPAFDDEGELLGVVLVRLDVEPLRRLLNDSTGLGDSGEVLVGTAKGDAVRYLFPPRLTSATAMSKSNAPIMSQGIAGGHGFTEGRDYRNQRVLAIYHPVAYQDPGYQRWAMVAKFDADEVYAPVRTLRNLLLMLDAGLLVGGVFAAMWWARRLTRPLSRLTQQADKFAGGDLSTEAAVDTHDEIGALAGALNNMAERLRTAHDELEERVELRTYELELAQQQLRRQAWHTRRILDTTSDAFVAMDEDGVITDWNTAAENVFGWTAKQAIGRSVAELIVPQALRQKHLDGLEHFLASGEGPVLGQLIEVTAMHRDGHEFPIELTISPLRDHGDMWTFNAFIHDITERKQAELELQLAKEGAEQASRAKSDFLANMSHEIRTPMNAIVGMTELTLDTELDQKQRDHLQTVLESAEHLLTIINEILDFSKIEAGCMELDLAPFSLRESLGDTLKALAVRAHRKNLELAYHVAPDVPDGVLGDVARLRQIIINLVGNAIKFTDEGEVLVDVASSPAADHHMELNFAVHDTGIGIAADRLDRIFESFTQADASTTRRFGGTGLGLSICKQLVELMGGRIWVESREGQGSSFHFTLPVQWCPQAAVTKPAEEADIAGLRVLVVDDNDTNRNILDEILRVWGMQPTCLAAAGPALSHIAQAADDRRPFRLVLTDLHMPEMDGLEFVDRLRQSAIAQQPIVIMLTSGERPGDAQQRQQLQIPVCLLKPVKQSELLEAILSLLGARRVVRTEAVDAAPAETQPLPPLHVLIAEDGEANRKLLEALLAKWGHSYTVAEDGSMAVAAAGRQQFDLILMDIEMPGLDGWQATQKIREKERDSGSHTPIIALTAHALVSDRQRCLDAGMDGYVSKPIRARRLLAAMAAAVAGRPSPVEPHAVSTPTPAGRTQMSDPENGRIDLKAALEAVGGDEELLRIVAGAFLDESPKLLDDIRRAIEAQDAKALQSAAHALKGTIRYYGSTEAYDLCYGLETAGAAGTLDGASEVFPRLAAQIEALRGVLKPMVQANSGKREDS